MKPFQLALMAGALAGPVVLQAQQPLVTRDSIYALATDSARYSGEPFVYLLDDGVIRLEADGRARRTYRQVIWVLSEDAVEQWAEFQYGYEPARQKLTLNWARVVGASGEVLTAAPDVFQESDVPASMSSPTYVDRKVLRFTLGRVRVGTLVDVSYTIDDLRPWRQGDFFANWVVNPGTPVRRSRLQLDTPAEMTPRVVEENLDFHPTVEERNGRRVTTWALRDVPGFELEPFASDSNGVVMRIDVAGQSSWTDVGRWYGALARDRYTSSPALERKLADLVKGAQTLDDSVRAVHRFVADDIRYVAVALGLGGYQPRSATEVLSSAFGDCKDKATLFIAMLRRMGVTANPVLLNNGGSVERRLPSIQQFDHAIAAVERVGGRVFVDLTASRMRWGDLPESVRGQFALVVEDEDKIEEVEIPDSAALFGRMAIRGAVDSAGYGTARVEMEVSGDLAIGLRQVMAQSPDSAMLAQMTNVLAAMAFPDAQGDSLRLTDAGERVRVELRMRRARVAQVTGPVMILAIPFGELAGADYTSAISQLESRVPRRFPIDIAQVSSTSAEMIYEMEVPAGWKLQPVGELNLSSVFGEIQRTVSQQEGRLRFVQRSEGKRGTLPPERVKDLVAWLEQLGEALQGTRSLVLTRPGP